MKMILIFTQSNIWLIRWIWKFKPPVWDGRKADMHITAAITSIPESAASPSSAPYKDKHGANMKIVCPRNTVKRDIHQKCAPNFMRISV